MEKESLEKFEIANICRTDLAKQDLQDIQRVALNNHFIIGSINSMPISLISVGALPPTIHQRQFQNRISNYTETCTNQARIWPY